MTTLLGIVAALVGVVATTLVTIWVHNRTRSEQVSDRQAEKAAVDATAEARLQEFLVSKLKEVSDEFEARWRRASDNYQDCLKREDALRVEMTSLRTQLAAAEGRLDDAGL